MILANGDTYEGSWKEGKKEGTGVYTWQEGGVWEGKFMAGRRTGTGVYNDGVRRVEGEWFEDRLVKVTGEGE